MMDASPVQLKNRARKVCYERIYIEAFEIGRDSRDNSRWRTEREREARATTAQGEMGHIIITSPGSKMRW